MDIWGLSLSSTEILGMNIVSKYVKYDNSQTGQLYCARKWHAQTGHAHIRRRMFISALKLLCSDCRPDTWHLRAPPPVPSGGWRDFVFSFCAHAWVCFISNFCFCFLLVTFPQPDLDLARIQMVPLGKLFIQISWNSCP